MTLTTTRLMACLRATMLGALLLAPSIAMSSEDVLSRLAETMAKPQLRDSAGVAYTLQGADGHDHVAGAGSAADSREPEFDGSALVPYTNKWRLSFSKPGATPKEVGTVTDDLSPLEVGGKRVMKRTQTTTYDDGKFTSRDENVFDPKTMRPLWMDYWLNGQHTNHRDFDGRYVVFHPPGIAARVVAYPTAIYDFYGGMYGMLLTALPLREGYAATIPAVDENDTTFRSVAVQVLRRERVAASQRGDVETWVVETETSMGKMRFWMADQAPYMIRVEWDAPQGVTATYGML